MWQADKELETRRAISYLKNKKATGPDDIPAEALKTNIDTSVELLYPLFTEIWEKEEVPSDWREGKARKISCPEQVYFHAKYVCVHAWWANQLK